MYVTYPKISAWQTAQGHRVMRWVQNIHKQMHPPTPPPVSVERKIVAQEWRNITRSCISSTLQCLMSYILMSRGVFTEHLSRLLVKRRFFTGVCSRQNGAMANAGWPGQSQERLLALSLAKENLNNDICPSQIPHGHPSFSFKSRQNQHSNKLRFVRAQDGWDETSIRCKFLD